MLPLTTISFIMEQLEFFELHNLVFFNVVLQDQEQSFNSIF